MNVGGIEMKENNNKPMKNQMVSLKWVVRRKKKTPDGRTVYHKRGCKI